MDRVRNLIFFMIFLSIEFYIGLYVHDDFIRPYIGDVLVVPVLYFFVRIFVPQTFQRLPLVVFLFALLVEIGQYFQLVDLLGLEGNRAVRTVLGATFDFMDIFCYFCGFCGLFIYERFFLNKIANTGVRHKG